MLACSCNLFDDDPTEDIAESPTSFDERVLDAGHHDRSSHNQQPADNLITHHLTLSGVAPSATPEVASLETPAQPRVSSVSIQEPSGTASDADTQVLSLEASVTRPIQSGANPVDTQLPSRLLSLHLPAQSEVVFSSTPVSSGVAPLDTHRDSTEIAPMAITAQFEVAPLNTPVPSEPELSAPEPKIDLDTIIQEITEHYKTTDVGNNPVEILRHTQNCLVLGRAIDVVDPARCSEGHTSYIVTCIDRSNMLETSFEEIEVISNNFLMLEVQFYNEVYYVLCIHLIQETLTA